MQNNTNIITIPPFAPMHKNTKQQEKHDKEDAFAWTSSTPIPPALPTNVSHQNKVNKRNTRQDPESSTTCLQ